MIPFNKPYATGLELQYIQEAIQAGQTAGNGQFTKRCQKWLEDTTGTHKALLTHSCTAALEMCAILAGIEPGDEVIMPSYTFVSTANAFVLRGGVPVFVDVEPSCLNVDPSKIEAAITERTKAIVVVHYAGVGCDMNAILEIANARGIIVIEDAAQGALASYEGRALGTMGSLGALSFHETKNIISGEGGALLINDAELAERAEIVWEKGTNRSAFFRGDVDKYTWVDVGSSFLPGEVVAAFLWAQFESARSITDRRLEIWRRYHDAFAAAEADGRVRRPIIPDGRVHNAHMYYVLAESLDVRTNVIKRLRDDGYMAVFHYVPLHSSPAGKRFGRTSGSLEHTDDLSARLVRLPLWVGIDDATVDAIAAAVLDVV
ncbi:MAG: dTDP-4-amino-4,6-dideoxygalactose transaminase [Deltaproteobacteria bacterium]